jgi:hypothetical protein
MQAIILKQEEMAREIKIVGVYFCFMDSPPSSLVSCYKHFGGTQRLHL